MREKEERRCTVERKNGIDAYGLSRKRIEGDTDVREDVRGEVREGDQDGGLIFPPEF